MSDGLPLPPGGADAGLVELYGLAEAAVRRYLRAVGAVPPGPARAALAARVPEVLDELGRAAGCCYEATLSRRSLRRMSRTRRRVSGRRRALARDRLRSVVVALERVGDSAALVAVQAALPPDPGTVRLELLDEALAAVAAGLAEARRVSDRALQA